MFDDFGVAALSIYALVARCSGHGGLRDEEVGVHEEGLPAVLGDKLGHAGAETTVGLLCQL